MKEKIVLIIFLLAGIFPVTAQRREIDSLLHELSIAGDDSARAQLTSMLVDPYRNINLDSSLYYGQQSLLIAKKINVPDAIGWSYSIWGFALFSNGNYPEAMEAEFKALEIFKNIPDSLGIASAYRIIGFIHRNQDEYREAINYFEKARNIFSLLNDEFDVSVSFGEAGKAYEQLNILDTALDYTLRAYKTREKFKPATYPIGIAANLGTIYSKLGNEDLALHYFRQDVGASTQYEDWRMLAKAYNELGIHYSKNNVRDSAIYYSKKALQLNREHGFIVQILASSNALMTAFEKEKKFDSAFKYQQVMLAAKDSLFSKEKIVRTQVLTFNEELKKRDEQNSEERYQAKFKSHILSAGIASLLLIALILYRSNRNKQRANRMLKKQKDKIESTLSKLKQTQAELIQSEKMASLGELTAGIAHEIQNPLNFVNNFSEVNKELLIEMKEEIEKGNILQVKLIANDLIDNEEKINHHGKRADGIVKAMLLHSRNNTGTKEATDINQLTDEYVRLAYHGIRARDKSFQTLLRTDFDRSLGPINVNAPEIGRVILNLVNNAFYAVKEKKSRESNNKNEYEPAITVATHRSGEKIFISVKDNGVGMPSKLREKIFQPFFTTKPTGQGTGLGLSLSYDIIKAHGGELKVNSKEGEGSEFIIELPIS